MKYNELIEKCRKENPDYHTFLYDYYRSEVQGVASPICLIQMYVSDNVHFMEDMGYPDYTSADMSDEPDSVNFYASERIEDLKSLMTKGRFDRKKALRVF